MIKNFVFLLITFLLAIHSSVVVSEIEGEKKDTFPNRIYIQHSDESSELVLTGEAERTIFFFSIYDMAHYVDEKLVDSSLSEEEIYEKILLQNNIKQISMVFSRSLTAEQIQEALIDGIKLNTNDEEYAQIVSQIEEFIRPITQDVEENDEFMLRRFPNGRVVSSFQGREISSVENETFARALWSMWFGNDSIVNKKSLIKHLLTSS